MTQTFDMGSYKMHLHQGDLPADVAIGSSVAIDTETLGLNLERDRLCLVQLTFGDGHVHLVQFKGRQYNAPVLSKILTDPKILKLFHFARFDVGMLQKHLGVLCRPIYCTKIASKLTRTYTDRHGLKDLTRETIGVELSKQQQSSDWGQDNLSEAQMAYAASDVLHLHGIKEKLDVMLARENRTELAQSCFDFLPTRALLDLSGWPEVDIFAHSS